MFNFDCSIVWCAVNILSRSFLSSACETLHQLLVHLSIPNFIQMSLLNILTVCICESSWFNVFTYNFQSSIKKERIDLWRTSKPIEYPVNAFATQRGENGRRLQKLINYSVFNEIWRQCESVLTTVFNCTCNCFNHNNYNFFKSVWCMY